MWINPETRGPAGGQAQPAARAMFPNSGDLAYNVWLFRDYAALPADGPPHREEMMNVTCLPTMAGPLPVATWPCRAQATPGETEVHAAVVRFEATAKGPSCVEPRLPGSRCSQPGAGFVVPGKRLLTHSHGVADATFLQLQRAIATWAARPGILRRRGLGSIRPAGMQPGDRRGGAT